jgi:hypothetical protein
MSAKNSKDTLLMCINYVYACNKRMLQKEIVFYPQLHQQIDDIYYIIKNERNISFSNLNLSNYNMRPEEYRVKYVCISSWVHKWGTVFSCSYIFTY